MEELTEDITTDAYTLGDINYLCKMCVRYLKQRILQQDGIPGEGQFAPCNELKWEVSRINVLKVATLTKTNEMLWAYWDEALDYRSARHLNACLGQEVDKLVEMCHKYTISREELHYDGHCQSRHGVRCKCLHGRED